MKFILCLFPCWYWSNKYKYEGYICKIQFNPVKEVSKSKKKFLLNFWYLFFFKRSSSIIVLVFQMCLNKVKNKDLFRSEYNTALFLIFSSKDNFLFFDDLFEDIFSAVLLLVFFDFDILLFFCLDTTSSFCFLFISHLFKSSFIISISFWYSGFNLNKYILSLFVLIILLSSLFSSLFFSLSFSSFFSFSLLFLDFSFSIIKNNFLIEFMKISLLSVLI